MHNADAERSGYGSVDSTHSRQLTNSATIEAPRALPACDLILTANTAHRRLLSTLQEALMRVKSCSNKHQRSASYPSHGSHQPGFAPKH